MKLNLSERVTYAETETDAKQDYVKHVILASIIRIIVFFMTESISVSYS